MPFPIEKSKELTKVLCAFGMQILSLFIAPFPSLHDAKAKPQLDLYALSPIAFRIANQ
jgi:hypothetical protein